MCGGGWESFLTWLVHSSNSARFYESGISQDLEDKAVEICRVSPRALSLPCWRLHPHQLLLRKSLGKYIRALCLPLGAWSIVSPGPTDSQTDAQLQVKQSFQEAWKHNTKYFRTLLSPAEKRLSAAYNPPLREGLKAFEDVNELQHFPGELWMGMAPLPYPFPALEYLHLAGVTHSQEQDTDPLQLGHKCLLCFCFLWK